MSGGIDLQKAVDHANLFWAGPCEDRMVWKKLVPIIITNELANFHLDSKEWEPVFLNYAVSENLVREGLYFIPLADADLSRRIEAGFSADAFPNRFFVCSFRDRGADLDLGSINRLPPHTGLNDCAHFIAECLRHAGVPISKDVIDVDTLLTVLRNRSDTKTLAWLVNVSEARRIIRANLATATFSGTPSILQQGDIIAFGNADHQHIHSTMYLGNEQVTHHTVVNHPDKPNHQNFDPATKMNQNWEFESNDVHPLVTIIHFATAGEAPGPGSVMVGWWKAGWRGQAFFYHFSADGHVGWTPPTVTPTSSTPIMFPRERRGYWFDNFVDLRICWTHSGSFELYKVPRPARGSPLSGVLNDDPIVLTKL
jgi:hypothetical protein